MRELLSLFLVCAGVSGQSWCSLVVSADRAGDKEERVVTVQEDSGRVTEQFTVNGTASFCGLGIRPVTVTVGSPGCRQVVVRNVGVSWGETRRLQVIHDTSTCNQGDLPVAACAMLLRVFGVDQKPIAGATLAARAPRVGTHIADKYGRMFQRVVAGNSWKGTISAAKHRSQEVDIMCVSDNYSLERCIILRATPCNYQMMRVFARRSALRAKEC